MPKENQEQIICVDFRSIWDGGYDQKTQALLNLDTGEITVKTVEIDGLYFRDSISVMVEHEDGVIAIYDVFEDSGEYCVAKEDLLKIKAHYKPANKNDKDVIVPWSSNLIQEIESDKASLEVYECECGYHMGFDSSYSDQVDDFVSAECPSCKKMIRTQVETDQDANQHCVKLNEFTYFYAQGWHHPQGDEIDYAEDVIDIREHSDSEIEEALLSMYGYDLAHLKKECGESWKQLAAEYLFEYSVSF